MSKGKLEKFEELRTFGNCIEIPDAYLIDEHPLKGKWAKEFFKNSNPIVLELGCGKGEYSVNQAKAFPHKNFIGVDIKGNRLWKGAKMTKEENLKNVGFVRTRIDHISKVFGKDEISDIWITFPDPQPQQSREKKRLTSLNFLEKYKPFLKRGGTIHLKTDNFPLYEYTLQVIEGNEFKLLDSTDNLYDDLSKNPEKFTVGTATLGIKTFYERRFLEEGKNICYLRFQISS